MRYLQNENDTLTFKAGDTSEIIRLSARNDNEPIIWSDGDTAEIHVDKDDAHVKTVTATLVIGSNNVTFSTSELSDLPAGKYQLEVWTNLASDGTQAIWPSQGMLDFTIDRNADSLEGGAITTITLDTFKDQLNQAIKEAKSQATPGKSAYQLWLDEGNKGSEQDFLASLKGEKGDAGKTGETGQTGQPGLSAYQLAVQSGFKGSEKEWLDYLRKGPKGEKGDSAYQEWLNAGHKGSETDFLNSLIGPKGDTGSDGKSAYDIWKSNGNVGDEQAFLKSLVGPKGDTGESAYQEAVDSGFVGSQNDWLRSLNGESAYDLAVSAGYKGDIQSWLKSLVGPKGDKGDPGQDAKAPTLKMGAVQSVASDQPAKADLKDNGDNSYTLTLSIPQGAKGETGGINQVVKPDLTIGKITTVNNGEPATASLTKTSETGYAINLNIPAGKAGEQGPQGEPGKPGKDGKAGADGQPGKDGKDGKSAYELAVSQGFVGDLKAWLASLKGEQGPAGKDGERGPAGKDGQDGKPGEDGNNGLNGHSIWYTSEGINWTQNNPTVTMQSVANASNIQKPEADDLMIDANGDVHKITAVSDDTVTLDATTLMTIKGQNGAEGATPTIDPTSKHWIIDGTDTGVTAQGQDGRDGQDATSDLLVQNGMVEIGGVNYGLVSEHASSQLRQSDFNYQQDMAIRIIPQSNFKTWAGITDGSWTLDVDNNTLTNDADNSKKIKLMTGMYLLRDISSDINVKSTSSFNMKNGELISQITQLIVTPYMVVANAVVTESVNGSFTTKVEAYWRPNWDTDYSPYYGVSNDWRKL
ncbi:hypothetical protein PSA87_05075 [Limosilactobacillus reuteri]|uniref:hypothetical protein n=1 Tax=Limosilactobacillus reuteri TaxID=1598 RepID=UPI002362D8D9|nr:hypothetical protein [Limosilactobacillus reuteri]MDD1401002.1 hypothetical protein [Limosilactobacillus reuteri]